MHELLETAHHSGEQPWASMYVDGHGDHWRAAGDFVRINRDSWEAALL